MEGKKTVILKLAMCCKIYTYLLILTLKSYTFQFCFIVYLSDLNSNDTLI